MWMIFPKRRQLIGGLLPCRIYAGSVFGHFFYEICKTGISCWLFMRLSIFYLLVIAVSSKGPLSVYAVMLIPFFMSIMFPTIFALGISGLGRRNQDWVIFYCYVNCRRRHISAGDGSNIRCNGGNIQVGLLGADYLFCCCWVFCLAV